MKFEPMRLVHLRETARIFFETLPISAREISDQLTARRGTWVALEGGKIVGFYQAVLFNESAPLWLDFIATAPEARRQGVGRKMLDHLESTAAQAGIEVLELSVRKTNVSAVAFHEALGYTVSAQQNSAAHVCLGKRLSGVASTRRVAMYGFHSNSGLLARVRRIGLKVFVLASLALHRRLTGSQGAFVSNSQVA